MKKVLVYFDLVEDCIFLLSCVEKFLKKKEILIKPRRKEGVHFDSWYDLSLFDSEFFDKKFNVIYKDYSIDFDLTKSKNISEFNNDLIEESYDKIIFINFYEFSTEKFFDKPNLSEKITQILCIQHELIDADEITIKEYIKNDSRKIISNTNLFFSHKNIYYDVNLSLIYFYFYLGFYHLNFDINVNKDNLVGFYHHFNHKKNRDSMIYLILHKLNKNQIKYKNYSKKLNNGITQTYDLLHTNGFIKSHISSYTDYINSIVVFISESYESSIDKTRYHVTEKTLKAIMFSKLNIIFILFSSYNSLIELKNKGYWFLNLEFLDLNNDKNRLEETLVIDSVNKSIDYIIDIFEKNKRDLYKTQEYLISTYTDKMQNNYNLLIKNIYNYNESDKFLNFILNE